MINIKGDSKMLKYRFILYLLTFFILAGVFGCDSRNKKNDKTSTRDVIKIKITMIAKSMANPVFLAARRGAEEAIKDISDDNSDVEVTLDWQTPLEESGAKQAEYIKQAVEAGTDAIIISCSDGEIVAQAIKDAVEKNNIPVMTFDSDAPESGRFAYYGPDDVEMGERLMSEMARITGGKGNIAILGGNRDAPNLRLRVNGILKGAVRYPDINIVGEFYHPEDETSSIDTMIMVNNMYPELDGWIMAGSWPMFGDKLTGIMEPGKYKIVAVDALPEQLKYIEKGYAHLLLGRPTYKWGEVAVEKIIDKIIDNKEIPPFIKMKIIPVSINNLGGWARQLKAWGYKNIPDKYFIM